MGSLAASVGDSDSAPRLLRGTGSDKVQLLVVMTAERGLCGGFNTNIAKLARSHAQKLKADGKEVKILTVGRKGRDQLKRDLGEHLVGHVDLSDVKRLSYPDAQNIAKDLLERFDNEEFDVATIFYSKFENVVSQIPTAQQVIPLITIPGRQMVRRAARSTTTSPRKKKSCAIFCRAVWRRRSSRRSSRTRPRSRAHGCRRWTTPRAMRAK